MSGRLELLRRGARNALDLLVEGGVGAPSHTPFEVVSADRIARLRRYRTSPNDAKLGPVLLIPPLMVYSEVYDISPQLSGVAALLERGVDLWLLDFGAPEGQLGGMDRTLDDHLLAIDRAIDEVIGRRDAPVHLVGYSQGGMFCYEAAALRKSRGLASMVTFGAPVDMTRNLPVPLHDKIAARLLAGAGKGLRSLLGDLHGLPAVVTASAFKLLYPGNGLKHLALFVGLLPDREALEAYVPKRRFLRGEGFTGWPGPAFLDFVEQVVAENRLRAGGLVIDHREVSLSDITCPVLYFYGRTDNLARPKAVKAIERAAPRAEAYGIEVDSGHFGLVVGSRARQRVWPLVADWVDWRDRGGQPRAAFRLNPPP